MNWLDAVERTVTGLGYELVETERSPRGLLRVYIDLPFVPGAPEQFITVDDCERVTRQLQHVLEVEGGAYERLEVSSPGLDRPLKTAIDYQRFSGQDIELTLKLPFQGRKKYRGLLQALPEAAVAGAGADPSAPPAAGAVAPAWRLLLRDAPPAASAKGAGGKGLAKPKKNVKEQVEQALDFALDEVREARLVPVLDFKGRRFAPGPVAPAADPLAAMEQEDGGRKE